MEDYAMEEKMNEIAAREKRKIIPIDKPKKINTNLEFSEEQYMKIKKGIIPREMEDKWFIFFEDNWLYFHRSWTGHGIYKSEIIKRDNKYFIKEFYVERNKEKYNCDDESRDIEIFTFLIFRKLLNEDAH